MKRGRPRNSRRTLLSLLKGPRDRLKWIHDHWTWLGNSQMFERDKGVWRKRKPLEYPENSVAEWLMARDEIAMAIAELRTAQDFITEQMQNMLGK